MSKTFMLRNWVVTICNKIIISLYFVLFSYLVYISTSRRLMATILGRLVVKWGGTTNKVTWTFDRVIQWSRDKWKTLYFYFHEAYSQQNLQEVASDELMSSRKSNNLLIKWPYQVKSLKENAISPFSQDLWPTDLTGWWFMMRNNKLQNNMPFQLLDLVMSHDKLKRYISTSVRLMSNELERGMTYVTVIAHNGHMTQSWDG